MPYAEANGLKLAYETFGEPAAPPVLMIMGLGAQMIAWPDDICESLAKRGHRVLRYDNRDVGESTHLVDQPAPAPLEVILRRRQPPYSLADMADDAAGLLKALDLESAHVVGASLGGFIAQTLAIRHRALVRSLTLIMTSTGSRRVGHPRPDVMWRMRRMRVATSRDEAVAAAAETFRVIGSPGYPFNEEYVRGLAGRGWDRDQDRRGVARQLAAAISQPDRTIELRSVKVPTVVLHGLDDPLIHVSGGMSIAKAVPGARFVGYAGMGHDLPRGLWPEFVDEICTVAAAGEAS